MTPSLFNPERHPPINMRSLLSVLVASLALCGLPRSICAQIFVTNSGTGTVSEYSTSGAPLDLALISGLILPQGIAISGEILFVTSLAAPDSGAGRVGKYTTSGAAVDSTLINLFGPSAIAISAMDLFVVSDNISSESSKIGKFKASGAVVDRDLIAGLSFPNALAVSGNKLFVADFGNLNIGKYTTSGEPVNARIVPELTSFSTIAVLGDSLFVADSSLGTISEYNAATGALVHPNLITGLDSPSGLAVSGGYLFVSDYDAGTIGKYTLSGETVDATLVSGLDGPTSIAVIPASVADISPTWTLLLLAVTATLSLKARPPRRA
jgi:hypothetical protein